LGISVLLVQTILTAGETNKLPIASSGNTIDLTVTNSSYTTASKLKVEPVNVPAWITFAKSVNYLKDIKPNQSLTVTFTFAVDKTAPVLKDTVLKFRVTTADSESWEKKIAISVSPPDKFELSQNYPNPFNPATHFDVMLPRETNLEMIVYNVFAQNIKTLVNESRSAGYQMIEWNGTTESGTPASSGVYFVRMKAGNYSSIKKIMLMK